MTDTKDTEAAAPLTPEERKGKVLGAAIGLVPTIGSQIPLLVKNQQQAKQWKGMRDGQGSRGQAVALQGGAAAARNARSIAAGATGPSKAFAARAATQMAQDAQLEAGRQGALVGMQEQQYAMGQLASIDKQRRDQLAKVGAAVGGGLAQMTAMRLAAGDQEVPGPNVEQGLRPGQERRAERRAEAAPVMQGTPVDQSYLQEMKDRARGAEEARAAEQARRDRQEQERLGGSPYAGAGNKGYGPSAQGFGMDVSPAQLERQQIQAGKRRVLGSAEAAILAGSGMGPADILAQLDPELAQRELALAGRY